MADALMAVGMDAKQVRVLFVYMSDSDLDQMRHLASGLAEVGPFVPYSCALAQYRQVLERGLPASAIPQGRPPHVEEWAAAKSGEKPHFSLRQFAGRIAAAEPLKSLRMVYGVARNAMFWRKKRHEAWLFLKSNRIDSVVTCQDVTLNYLPVLKAAETLSIPVILARSAMVYYHDASDGGRNSLKHTMRAGMPQMHVDRADSFAGWIMNNLVRRFMPEQIAKTMWGDLVPFPSSDLLALALAGIRPRQLWQIGQESTSHVVVSGADEAKFATLCGVPKERMLMIGSAPLDRMRQLLVKRDQLRSEICARLGLDPARPIALVCGIASWEHRCATYNQQFDYLRDFYSALANSGFQIVLTLHPLNRQTDYQALADEYSIKFLDRPLIESIAFADVYLSSELSSTVRWALAMGLPTLVYHFNPGNIDFKLPPDYPKTMDRDHLVKWLSTEFCRCPILTAELLKPAERRLGLIADGRFYEHLAAALQGRPVDTVQAA